jgi:hypothetical protein
VPPLAARPTVTVLATVAPAAGLVNDAASGGGAEPFCTVTDTLPLPVLPLASRTATTSVWGPFGVFVVTQGSATCVSVELWLQTVELPTVIV